MKNLFKNYQIQSSYLVKSSLVLLFCLLSQIRSEATYQKAMLRFREVRGNTISVSIDGRRFNKMGKTITVSDLTAGSHLIEVFKYNSNGYGYSKGQRIYDGYIWVKPGRIYYCTLFRSTIDIEENCCVDDYGNWNQNDNWDNWDERNNRWNNNKKWENNDLSIQHEGRNEHSDWNNHDDNDNWKNDNRDQWNKPRHDNNYEGETWNSYEGAISEGRFQQMIDQMRKSAFESSKVNTANAALKNNRLTVNQLIRILKELTFESTQIEFAKNNYRKLMDKNNFFMINDLFVFDSSKDEINEFINKQ